MQAERGRIARGGRALQMQHLLRRPGWGRVGALVGISLLVLMSPAVADAPKVCLHLLRPFGFAALCLDETTAELELRWASWNLGMAIANDIRCLCVYQPLRC